MIESRFLFFLYPTAFHRVGLPSFIHFDILNKSDKRRINKYLADFCNNPRT